MPPPPGGGWEPADPEPSPRRRPLGSTAPSAYATLPQAAIALLLHKPAIASLADPQALADIAGNEGALLRDILTLLKKRPESSTGMLLGHWYGTQEGELLAHLAGQERLIPAHGIEQQFEDIIRRLSALPLRQRIVGEIDELKSRPFEGLSRDDKARLPELLRALRDLDTRTAPRGP